MEHTEKYQIIELLSKTGIIKEECLRICGENEYTDDLTQEITILLLEYDDDKIIDMNVKGKLLNFIRATIKRQYKSETSPFYVKYKKYERFNNGEDDKVF